MLVTPYPVSCAWSKPEQEEDTMPAQHCSASSSLISSDLIDIQTTLSETFTPHTSLLHQPPPPHPSSTTSTTSSSSNNNSDYFSQRFENVMEPAPAPAPTTNISPDPGRGQEDTEHLVTVTGSLKHRQVWVYEIWFEICVLSPGLGLSLI